MAWPPPGVVRLVDEALKSGVQVAVCSTSNEKAVAQIVKMMGEDRAKKIQIFAGAVTANSTEQHSLNPSSPPT